MKFPLLKWEFMMRRYSKKECHGPFEGCIYELNDKSKTRIYIIAVGEYENKKYVFYLSYLNGGPVLNEINLNRWKRTSIFKKARLIEVTYVDFNGPIRGAGYSPRRGVVIVLEEAGKITLKVTQEAKPIWAQMIN